MGSYFDIIKLLNVWATRKKLDGRCDYRKEQGNSPKRSLSLKEVQARTGSNPKAPITRPNRIAEDIWQAQIVRRRVAFRHSFLKSWGVA